MGENNSLDSLSSIQGIMPSITIGYDEVPLDADLLWLLFLLFLSLIWLTYILFYNSRLFGLILSKLINNIIIPKYLFPNKKRCEQPSFHVGSFSITWISGKIMFRDVVFVTPDYSLHIQDGWIIFRWWIQFKPKNIRTNDFSHSDSRLSLSLNGYELHIYNRSELYSKLEKLFGIYPSKFNCNVDSFEKQSNVSFHDFKTINIKSQDNSELIKAYTWRSFFPLTKIEILSGRFVFGNHLIPSTLLVTFEEAHITYTSRPALSSHDLFTHIAKAKVERFKVILAPSPKYIGIHDEPPRFMGEGFIVFQANSIDLYYYQDEPGIISFEPEKVELLTGDIVDRFTSPAWGLDIKCGKGTHFSYGPWADRQRYEIYNFFFPQDYQKINPTPKPKSGELRQLETFYIRLSTLADATIDTLFQTKDKETKALHVNAGPGSYLEISLPWITEETGYYSHIVGQILHLDATTNLDFRSLAESETLEFNLKIVYPLVWNSRQTWTCSITGCKATVQLIYAHKIFFSDLIDDWASKDRPDILQFVPYTWKVNIILKDFELITIENDYNWIDCSTKFNNENNQLAICGDIFDLSFDLPFDEFLPNTIPVKIWIQGESVFASLYFPDSNPHQDNMYMLHKFAKLFIPSNSANVELKPSFVASSDLFASNKKWRSATKDKAWIDCWSVPIVALSITYTYHPIPPKVIFPKDIHIQTSFTNISTPEREELLLGPIRPESVSTASRQYQIPENFDPGSMNPDLIEIELEVGPSSICLYGSLFRLLWNLKGNYVGEYQHFTDFNSNATFTYSMNVGKDKQPSLIQDLKPFDSLIYRSLAVTVSTIFHDICGHLMKSCDENEGSPSPCIYLERLCFEMDKKYTETKMQLIMSPVILHSFDKLDKLDKNLSITCGSMVMESLLFRGHAMLSNVDRPLESEALEYAWLVEVQIGNIFGRLTLPQFYNIIISLENFFLQVAQEDCSLQPPIPYRRCLHDMIQSVCSKTQEDVNNKMCPYSEDLKYRLIRVSLDLINLYFIEDNTILNLSFDQIRFSTCNLHSGHTSSGITALVKQLTLNHYLIKNNLLNSYKNSDIHLTNNQSETNDTIFYEVGKINLGPVFIDSAELLSIIDSYTTNQDTFLRVHDNKTKRLWFLWPEKLKQHNTLGKCGCVGGCYFYNDNCSRINFFSLDCSSNQNLILDLLFVESLLNPSESVLRYKTVSKEIDDLESPLESTFIFDKTNIYPPSSLSSLTKNQITMNNDLQSYSSNTQKKNRFYFFTKHLTNSAKGDKCNLPASTSTSSEGTSSSNDFLQSHQKKNKINSNFKERSLSESNETDSIFQPNFDLSTLDISQEKLNPSKCSLYKTKITSSHSTLKDPYFSADETFSSDSGSPTLVTAPTNSISKGKSDDTFNSFSSNRTLEPLSSFSIKDQDLISEAAFTDVPQSMSTTSAPYYTANSKDTEFSLNHEDDNQSFSNISFRSAVSSQDDAPVDALVDLRNQMEKPIIESPLLMSSYNNYLTTFVSKNFSTNQIPQANLILNSWKKFIPRLTQTSNHGFSCLRIVDKTITQVSKKNNYKNNSQQVLNENKNQDHFTPGKVYNKIDEKDWAEKEKNETQKSHKNGENKARLEKQISKMVDFRNEKLTVLIKFTDEVDIRLSPLCLDGLKTFIESLCSSFSTLHPLSILNHLNLLCFSRVRCKNQLKKEKILEFGQLKLKAWKSTLERERVFQKANNQATTGLGRSKLGDAIMDVRAHLRPSPAQSDITANQYEENKNSEFQVFISIFKINIIILQASLIEEFIYFSALDDIKDLTCVSLFSISISDINFDFHCSNKKRRSLHTIISNTIQAPPTSAFAQFAQSDIVSRLLFRKPKKERAEVEPITIETHELLEQEVVGIGAIGTLHGQLNRLKNNSSILKEAILTVVPQNQSKVSFKYDILPFLETNTQALNRKDKSIKSRRVSPKSSDCFDDKDWSNNFTDVNIKGTQSESTDKSFVFGFIMFECGLEDISLKIVKRNEVQELSSTADSIENEKKDFDKKEKKLKKEKDKKGVSSFIGEIGVVWFNFAAPPKTPNTRRIDFTRLDWHLLSTGTPSINAWLSAGDRFVIALKKANRLYEQRIISVVIYLMIAALEVKGIHIAPSSKYIVRKLTPFSKALQEDPSCQLMSVLRRYLNRYSSLKEVEKNLLPKAIPSLQALKKGVIVLSRQWKNSLYMPLLVEQNIRFTRGEKDASSVYQSSIPLRVLFENKNKQQEAPLTYMQIKSDVSDVNQEVFTEKSKLLQSTQTASKKVSQNEKTFKSKKHKTSSQPDILITVESKSFNQAEDKSENMPKRKLNTLPNLLSKSSKANPTFPLLSNRFESIGSGVGNAYSFLFNPNSNIGNNQVGSVIGKGNESQTSNKSTTSSLSSSEDNNCSFEPILATRSADTSNYHEENLYSWMARQQDYTEAKNIPACNLRRLMTTNNDIDSNRYNTLDSAKSNEESVEKEDEIEIPPGFVFVPTGVQLGNVRIIFQPLFFSLGLENLTEEDETNTAFDQLNPHISCSGSIRMLKVNIVESDFSDACVDVKCKNDSSIFLFNRSTKHATLKTSALDYKDVNLETLAFICDQLTVDLDFRKVKDFKLTEINTSDGSNINSSQPNTYQSEDGLEKEEKMPIVIIGPDGDINEITTMINFNVDINQIAQRVNLSLLRLLHQFESMFESIKKTQLELKANRVQAFKWNEFNDKKIETSDHTINIAEESRTSSYSSFRVMINEKDNVNLNIVAKNETTLTPSTDEVQAKCWKTMYYLLDLYDTTPETKTIAEKVSSQPQLETKITIEEDEDNRNKMKGGYEQLKEYSIDTHEALNTPTINSRKISLEQLGTRKPMSNIVSSDKIKTYTHALIHREFTPLIIFGVIKIKQVNSVAMLGGLKLDVDLSAFHVSLTHKEKVRGAAVHCKKWKESSMTGQLGNTTLSLLEEVLPTSQQLVVEMTVGKSNTLVSSQNKKGKDENSAFLSIGPIMIVIPQHPVALHGMMTRSSRQLSTTLQELRSSRQSSRSSRQPVESDNVAPTFKVGSFSSSCENLNNLKSSAIRKVFTNIHSENSGVKPISDKLIKPIVFQFTFVSESLTIEASLLPSLKTKYVINQVTSSGTMGAKAKFILDVREHTLSFNTLFKTKPLDSNLPSSASISLPLIHVSAEYIEDIKKNEKITDDSNFESFADGIVLRKGSYLNALADIGTFEHSLTTDLLNHLLLVQKVFMKEINEVVQKMSGYDKKRMDTSDYNVNDKFNEDVNFSSNQTHRQNRHLFSLYLRLKGIQITTTTPTNSAVRLETGPMELQLSNRVQNMSTHFKGSNKINLKMFIKLQVDLNVALGQLIKNAIFEEADSEFQQLAYFKTLIVMRNALQDELVPSSSSSSIDKEAVLITLRRPLVYFQTLALDKAVLVWLNYKNAYEYWNEQRANLNKEVISTTQQVLDKVRSFSAINAQNLGTLFLQLTIDDLGICLPISSPLPFHTKKTYDSELRSALVVTLENTRISACSCGSLVSKASFTGLCLRFVDDFETSLDDWKPDPSDSTVMNLCVVSEGTYEICSKTYTHSAQNVLQGNDAKWVLNVSWRVEGFDIHVDTSIGKQFSALFKTLTAIAGEEDEGDTIDYSSVTGDNINGNCIDNISNATDSEIITSSSFDTEMTNTVIRKSSLLKDSLIDNKQRSRLIEKKLNEQAKIINDLRQLGASENTIEQEIKRLHELESVVFNNFKRDVINKLRRQSLKNSFREKISLNKLNNSIAEDYILDNQMPNSSLESISNPKFVELTSSFQDINKSKASFDLNEGVDTKRALFDEKNYVKSGDQFANTKSKFVLKPLKLQATHSSEVLNYDPVSRDLLLNSSTESSSDNKKINLSNLNEQVNVNSSLDRTKIQNVPSDNQMQSPFVKRKNEITETKNEPLEVTSKSAIHPIQDPNIDFELDVKIFFNSGKCVFHARDSSKEKEEDYARKNELAKETNSENSSLPMLRNQTSRSNVNLGKTLSSTSNLKFNLSASRLRYAGPTTSTTNPNQSDFTVILIPGLDIKVHYNSKTIFTNPNPLVTSNSLKTVSEDRDYEISSLPVNLSKRIVTKKASCYAWMTLHSIPEETIITPHILDFMEQALEPIPIQVGKTSDTHQYNNSIDSKSDLITSAPVHYAVYGSFPVDVIVYLHMQPSVLRFSCLPVSRVECLLQLPSVDLVFSSKRLQDELDPHNQSLHGINPIHSRAQAGKYGHKRSGSDYRQNNSLQTETSIGGLSMTGCLADFSLYIFHPYGGQKKISGFQSESFFSTTPPSKTNNDRKDSLSLQVEFVKINISRSRKLVCLVETSLPQTKTYHSSHSSYDTHNKTVMIRFSTFCDIGSASFKYDMRRLTEILAFPKAWYRKALWKRMFLGDHSIGARNLFSDQEDNCKESNESSSSSSSSINEEDDEVKESKINNNQIDESYFSQSSIIKSSNIQDDEPIWLNFDDLSSSKKIKAKILTTRKNKDPSSQSSSFIHSKQIMSTPWQTLILFGVNLCKLNVHMNMGNVMGNTSWLTRGLRSEGKISIDSNGDKCFNIGLGLDGSSLDAKGGIVGGIIELSQIQTKVFVKENYGKEPNHGFTLQLDAFEKRLDYMGASILMLRVSDLDLTLTDEWRIDAAASTASNHPTKRAALIFIHCNLCWDQLQLLISKSTTPDTIKIIAKLEEFFSQQFHSSKRVFSSLQPLSSKSFSQKDRRDKPMLQTKTKQLNFVDQSYSTDARHHRHWQKVLKLVSNASLSTLSNPLPNQGTILGGTVELNGNNLSLACFYGINFRSKSWALFSMRQPSISFASEAQDVCNSDNVLSDTHIIQNFNFSLGRRGRPRLTGANKMNQIPSSLDCFYAHHSNMATVCRISRTVMFPPQFKTMHEWFQYAFASSDLDQINRFPVIEFERSGDGFGSASSNLPSADLPNRRMSLSPKSSESHQNKEIIFALPSFQVELKTEHLQSAKTPTINEIKPRIDCTFVTDFDDHIFVAVDAESYYFLHELITSYIKEKQNNYAKNQSPISAEKFMSESKSEKVFNADQKSDLESSSSITVLEKDWREFNCQTWHLEPTVRLITWAGKNIEPYGVEYILQRLGFTQARITVPKWIQRGAMDPLDKVLSSIMFQIIHAIKNEPNSHSK